MLKTIGEWAVGLLVKTFVKMLPDRMKRLLMIVSLYNYLLSCSKTDEATQQLQLKELNEALLLATTSSRSLAFGLLFTNLFWSNLHAVHCLNEATRKEIMSDIPSYLRYSRNSDIEADLRLLDHVLLKQRIHA